MKILFQTKNNYHKFGIKIINLLVENFSQTFFVGGMVRDLILQKSIYDIDIATEASPESIIQILQKNKIKYNDQGIKFGVITIPYYKKFIEITTFRQDTYNNSRFPKIKFTNSYKIDSKRRDFTINSLYLHPKTNKIFDPQNGLEDIKNHIIKFIGDPTKRIAEDPLRIVRAFTLQKKTNFNFETKTQNALKKNFANIKKISSQRIKKEIKKIFKLCINL